MTVSLSNLDVFQHLLYVLYNNLVHSLNVKLFVLTLVNLEPLILNLRSNWFMLVLHQIVNKFVIYLYVWKFDLEFFQVILLLYLLNFVKQILHGKHQNSWVLKSIIKASLLIWICWFLLALLLICFIVESFKALSGWAIDFLFVELGSLVSHNCVCFASTSLSIDKNSCIYPFKTSKHNLLDCLFINVSIRVILSVYQIKFVEVFILVLFFNLINGKLLMQSVHIWVLKHLPVAFFLCELIVFQITEFVDTLVKTFPGCKRPKVILLLLKLIILSSC